MCGAVRFTAQNVPATYGICHCEMCRRWTGSAFVNVEIPSDGIAWSNEAQIGTLQTSDWAERGWCRRCGSHLYWRMTDHSVDGATTDVPLGLFDDANGFALSHEIYIDHKPDSFSFVGDGHKKLTRAEYLQDFPAMDSDQGDA